MISANSPEKRVARDWGSTWPTTTGEGLNLSNRVLVARTKAPLLTPKKRANPTAARKRVRYGRKKGRPKAKTRRS